MEIISGGVTAPIGFLAAGMHAGVRKNKKKNKKIFSIQEKKEAIIKEIYCRVKIYVTVHSCVNHLCGTKHYVTISAYVRHWL